MMNFIKAVIPAEEHGLVTCQTIRNRQYAVYHDLSAAACAPGPFNALLIASELARKRQCQLLYLPLP